MIEGRCGARLLLEAAQPINVFGKVSRQDFDRHFAAEPDIVRAINFAHAACAERGEDFIRAKLSACCNEHWMGTPVVILFASARISELPEDVRLTILWLWRQS